MKPMGMKNLCIVFLVFGSALWGCASQGNMEALQRDSNNITKELLALQRNLYDMNAEMQNYSTKLDALGKRTDALQKEVGEVKGRQGDPSSLRYQADLGARLEKLQLDVQNLTGRFEESKYFAEKTFRETNALKKTYETKIEELENDLGKGKVAAQVAPFQKFWKAEGYHQDYERLNPDNPYIQNVSIPRLKRFQGKYPHLLKQEH